MTTDMSIHVLRLQSLLEGARKECEAYDESLLQIQLKVGGKAFMEMSKAFLSYAASLSSADLVSVIDANFEEAVKSDSSLEIVVHHQSLIRNSEGDIGTAGKAAGENLCQ